MRLFHTITGLFAATLILVSCTRENEIIEPQTLPPGGLGGKISLKVTPQHHKKNVNQATIYIWYAKTSQQDLRSFDDSMNVAVDGTGRPVAMFDSLTQGDYYIYAKGVDYELDPGKDEVFGGAHFRVIDTLEKTYDLYIQTDNVIHH